MCNEPLEAGYEAIRVPPLTNSLAPIATFGCLFTKTTFFLKVSSSTIIKTVKRKPFFYKKKIKMRTTKTILDLTRIHKNYTRPNRNSKCFRWFCSIALGKLLIGGFSARNFLSNRDC